MTFGIADSLSGLTCAENPVDFLERGLFQLVRLARADLAQLLQVLFRASRRSARPTRDPDGLLRPEEFQRCLRLPDLPVFRELLDFEAFFFAEAVLRPPGIPDQLALQRVDLVG